MTSLAVLPPLKRSITDIMDEEIYHDPNIPVQFATGSGSPVATPLTINNATLFNSNGGNQFHSSQYHSNQQNQQNQQNQFSSVASSPNMNYASLFTQNNSSNHSFPEFLDNLKHNYTNLNSNNTVNPSFIDSNSFINYNEFNNNENTNNTSVNPNVTVASSINPFTTYGNPDSFVKSRQATPAPQYTNLNSMSYVPVSLPYNVNDDSMNALHRPQKKKKQSEDFLSNTNISPSHLMSLNPNDDVLYIFNPNETMEMEPTSIYNRDSSIINNSIVPGYENDYLVEPVEDDVSDDEDNGDDYYVDDDMMMGFSNYEGDNYNEIFNGQVPAPIQKLQRHINEQNQNQEQHIQEDQFQQFSEQNQMQGTIEIQPEVSSYSPDSMLVQQYSLDSLDTLPSLTPDEEDNEEEEDNDYNMEDDNSHPPVFSRSKNHEPNNNTAAMTAAEISANNPNHLCDLINPSTGKPCNRNFSRPYDLIRHQETIHASKKKIFRCVICEGRYNGGLGNGKDKTFSRADALSRHIKVKHRLDGKEALDIINEAKENVEYIPSE
ncbi:uncharacterized protein RJT21DRAFT_122532 [Scheffersomyces amazonensis]|uniref:uncharacterized protein n=1 Tax=Scheffersomyces amazonensis TaxID=1078765 RepID=UPI00315D2F6C